MASDSKDSRQVIATLILLTLVSGVVDAVSYLGLGHVFVANMTGNVVLLGCAAAGAAGFSVSATLTSLAAFVAGAVVSGRVAGRISDYGRLLLAVMLVEAGLVGAAALIALLSASPATGWARYTDITILAVAMGMRTGAVRRLGVRDLTTTVLTQTLAGLASDSTLGGGDNPRAVRGAAARCGDAGRGGGRRGAGPARGRGAAAAGRRGADGGHCGRLRGQRRTGASHGSPGVMRGSGS